MQNHLICIFLALLLSALACSCTEDIDFAVDAESPIVVKCILRRSAKQTLSLFYAGRNTASLQVPVENAKAVIRCGEVEVAEFVKSEGVEWSTDFTPDFRQQYTLEITVPGRRTIWAKTTFPGNAELTEYVKIFPNEYVKEIKEKYHLHMPKAYSYYIREGKAEPSRSAYKLWLFWTEVSFRQIYLGKEYLDPIVLYLEKLNPQMSEYVATDHPGADDFNLTEKSVSDLKFLYVPLNGRMYSFLCSWQKILLRDLPLHSKFLRIDHPRNFVNPAYFRDPVGSPLGDESCFVLTGELDIYSMLKFQCPFPYGVLGSEYYCQCFVSDEYDKYLKDVYTKYFNKDNFVLSQYDADNIYTNINEGVGIFGAVHYGYYIKSADDLLEEPPI